MGRDYKHHQRKRRYARKKRDELLDDHETMNDRLRKRIADLQQRLERAIDANQMLRVEYDGLLVVLDSQEAL